MINIINVNNIMLQFDSEDQMDEEMVYAYIELINSTMSTMFGHSQPKLLRQINSEVEVIELV